MALQTIPYDFADVVVAAASKIKNITGSVYFAPAGTTDETLGKRLKEIPLFVGTIALRGPGIVDITAYAENAS